MAWMRTRALRLLDDEDAARAAALQFLELPDVRLSRLKALTWVKTAPTASERRQAGRAAELVERCLARPDTATRWADTSGRWSAAPAERLQTMSKPWWPVMLLKLTGGAPQASSSQTGA